MKEKVIDITHQPWDLQMKRIMAMSDEEIMADAIWEFGSPANVEKYVERMRKAISNTMWGIRAKNNLAAVSDENDATASPSATASAAGAVQSEGPSV